MLCPSLGFVPSFDILALGAVQTDRYGVMCGFLADRSKPCNPSPPPRLHYENQTKVHYSAYLCHF